MRGGDLRLAKLRDDSEFYPTAELPVAGTVFNEELPGRLVSVISISHHQGFCCWVAPARAAHSWDSFLPAFQESCLAVHVLWFLAVKGEELYWVWQMQCYMWEVTCAASAAHTCPGLSFHQRPLKQQIWHLPNRWFCALCVWCSRFIFRHIYKFNFFLLFRKNH